MRALAVLLTGFALLRCDQQPAHRRSASGGPQLSRMKAESDGRCAIVWPPLIFRVRARAAAA